MIPFFAWISITGVVSTLVIYNNITFEWGWDPVVVVLITGVVTGLLIFLGVADSEEGVGIEEERHANPRRRSRRHG